MVSVPQPQWEEVKQRACRLEEEATLRQGLDAVFFHGKEFGPPVPPILKENGPLETPDFLALVPEMTGSVALYLL